MSVTDETLVAEVRRLAAENPDFVYQKPEGKIFCVYVEEKDGGLVGSCIMGQALINLGVDPDVLTHVSPISDVVFGLELGLSDRVRVWSNEVQTMQDYGNRWSGSVASADERYPLDAA